MVDMTSIVSGGIIVGLLGAMLLPIRKRLEKIDDMNDSLTIMKVDIGVMGEKIENIEKSII